MPQFIQIDISKLDNEILSIERKIASLRHDLEMKQSLKKYAYSLSVNTELPENGGTLNTDDTPKVKVSDFILNFLDNNGKVPTKEIVNAYAAKINSTDEKVYNNVSNALSRLKTDGKVSSEAIGTGRRAGYNWYRV